MKVTDGRFARAHLMENPRKRIVMRGTFFCARDGEFNRAIVEIRVWRGRFFWSLRHAPHCPTCNRLADR